MASSPQPNLSKRRRPTGLNEGQGSTGGPAHGKRAGGPPLGRGPGGPGPAEGGGGQSASASASASASTKTYEAADSNRAGKVSTQEQQTYDTAQSRQAAEATKFYSEIDAAE